MNFLSLFASVTTRDTIASADNVEHFDMPFFALGDTYSGQVTVLQETGDPTSPTSAFNIDNSSSIALTDGDAIAYAQATNIVVASNVITFDMVVNTQALLDAFAAAEDDSVSAFFEVRIVKDSQDELLLRAATTILKSVTATLPAPVLPVHLMYNSTITSLRGDPTSLEAVATVSLGTGTLLLIIIDDIVSGWLLVAGAADGGDPDGQVAPLDYDGGTNDRHWVKSLGF